MTATAELTTAPPASLRLREAPFAVELSALPRAIEAQGGSRP